MTETFALALRVQVAGFMYRFYTRLRSRHAGSVSEPDVRSAYTAVKCELEQTEALTVV